MRLLVAAVLLATAAIAPGVAAASHGQGQGPSPTPLLVELLLAAVVLLVLLGRHTAAHLLQSGVAHAGRAMAALARHRPHRVRPPIV